MDDISQTWRSASHVLDRVLGQPGNEVRRRGMEKLGFSGNQFRSTAEVKHYYRRMKTVKRRRDRSEDTLNEDIVRLLRAANVIPIDFIP